MSFLLLVVQIPIVGHQGRVDGVRAIQVRLRVIVLVIGLSVVIVAIMVRGQVIPVVTFVVARLEVHHGVVSSLVVFDMSIVFMFKLSLMIEMIISVAGLMVKDVTFFTQVQHLSLIDDAIALCNELGESAIMMSLRLHWMSGEHRLIYLMIL